ncbi:hypothetical protein ACFL4W_04630 [Planctomycetota bacterium]
MDAPFGYPERFSSLRGGKAKHKKYTLFPEAYAESFNLSGNVHLYMEDLWLSSGDRKKYRAALDFLLTALKRYDGKAWDIAPDPVSRDPESYLTFGLNG